MPAVQFPKSTATFFSITSGPAPVGSSMASAAQPASEVITHIQGEIVAMQNALRSFAQSRWLASDFHAQTNYMNPPFTASAAISSGTNSTAVPTADYADAHPGANFVRSSTTANSGYRFYPTNQVKGASGLSYRAVFMPRASVANTQIIAGIHNGTSATEPTSGCYLIMAPGGIATFKAATNGTLTSAPTTVTLAAGTWYTVDIGWISATEARCMVRDDAGTVLLDQTVSSNVPTSASYLLWPQWIGTCNLAAATDIALVDYIGFGPDRPPYVAWPS